MLEYTGNTLRLFVMAYFTIESCGFWFFYCFHLKNDWFYAENNYPFLADLTSQFKPKSILEVGVRLGYSAIAFLSGSQAERYTGIDSGYDFLNWKEWAEDNLEYYKSKTGHIVNIKLFNINTQTEKIDFLNNQTFDFIFIDACHSEEGCYQDICNFWQFLNIGGVMVVDDSKESESACEGIVNAIKKFTNDIQEPNYNINFSFRGDWIIKRTK